MWSWKWFPICHLSSWQLEPQQGSVIDVKFNCNYNTAEDAELGEPLIGFVFNYFHWKLILIREKLRTGINNLWPRKSLVCRKNICVISCVSVLGLTFPPLQVWRDEIVSDNTTCKGEAATRDNAERLVRKNIWITERTGRNGLVKKQRIYGWFWLREKNFRLRRWKVIANVSYRRKTFLASMWMRKSLKAYWRAIGQKDQKEPFRWICRGTKTALLRFPPWNQDWSVIVQITLRFDDPLISRRTHWMGKKITASSIWLKFNGLPFPVSTQSHHSSRRQLRSVDMETKQPCAPCSRRQSPGSTSSWRTAQNTTPPSLGLTQLIAEGLEQYFCCRISYTTQRSGENKAENKGKMWRRRKNYPDPAGTINHLVKFFFLFWKHWGWHKFTRKKLSR